MERAIVGMERMTKLALTWHVGTPDATETCTFVEKLARACNGSNFQITTDGWSPYQVFIRRYFPNADFGMLIKIFATAATAARTRRAR
jgi:hypothetical protein